MSMRINSTGATGSAASHGVSAWRERQQAMKDVFTALQSGDLGTAQKAFATVAKAGGAATSTGPLAQLGQALQSGDLAAAQKAAQAWQAKRAGHHHGGDGDGAAVGSAVPALTAAATAAAGTASAMPASGVGSLLNLTA